MAAQANDTATLQQVTGAAVANTTGNTGNGKAEKAKPVIIKGDKPAAPNSYVVMTPQMIHFKTEALKNEKGDKIGEGKKHPTVEMYLPIPTPERLAAFLLADGPTVDAAGNTVPGPFDKERELVMQAVQDVIYRVARMQINEQRENNKDAQITPSSLNYDKLDFTAIANMPKGERGAYVPEEQEIKDFLASYLEIMPAATGKTKERIENHVTLFEAGFKKQRSQKDILEMFQGMLAVFCTQASPETVEEHQDVIEYFNNRLTRMLKSEEKITMDQL